MVLFNLLTVFPFTFPKIRPRLREKRVYCQLRAGALRLLFTCGLSSSSPTRHFAQVQQWVLHYGAPRNVEMQLYLAQDYDKSGGKEKIEWRRMRGEK